VVRGRIGKFRLRREGLEPTTVQSKRLWKTGLQAQADIPSYSIIGRERDEALVIEWERKTRLKDGDPLPKRVQWKEADVEGYLRASTSPSRTPNLSTEPTLSTINLEPLLNSPVNSLIQPEYDSGFTITVSPPSTTIENN
jgi:hypothetical protein